jgi:hypothetical protein
MANGIQDLYSLLPAVYRERDAQQNFELQALLSILTQQGVLLDAHLQQFYENLFIETCEDWVVPYVGDLVSNNILFDPSRSSEAATATSLFTNRVGKDLRPPVAVRVRADVAKTIYYRRRKATPAMLEELARDVTGWPAHVVEFFQLLGWTQFLEHPRLQCTWTDLRSLDAMERIAGAFDQTSHTIDVRPPSQQEGWYDVRNIGFFLWRLQSFPLVNVPARATAVAWRYHFSPLGNPAPLFTRPKRELEAGGLVSEYDVPAPIRRILFDTDLRDYANQIPLPPPPNFTRLYGAFGLSPTDPAVASQTSLYVRLNGNGIDPADPNAPPNNFMPQVVCMRLDPWPGTQPTGKVVAIDVSSGRLAIGTGWGAVNAVDVSYWYGFPSGLGGGTYDRRQWLTSPSAFPTPPARYAVQQNGPAGTFASVVAAISQWQADQPSHAVISILDNRTYAMPASITLANGTTLAIEAAQGTRPLLQAQTPGGALAIDVSGIAPNDDQRNAVFTLNGVVLEGFVHVTGDLGKLRLLHSTLIPGRQLDQNGNPVSTSASLVIEPVNASGHGINLLLRVEAAFSILGQIMVPEVTAGIWLLDCIVQGTGAAPAQAVSDPAGKFAAPLVTERSTFFGSVQVKSLQASEAIFTAAVTSQRTQQGCVRFSYVPPGSLTPRRFRCQPDLAVADAIAAALQADPLLSIAAQQQISQDVQSRIVPSFTTTRYGQPAFAQLLLSCPVEIRTGAEDGSEMGAFCHLKQPQRESNLKIRLREYLPFGLEPAISYVT